jgi:quercetin dioxygenase-like cupin family protein
MYIALPQKTKVLTPGEGRTVAFPHEAITFKATGEETGGAWELFELTAEATVRSLLHSHPWSEAFYILEGVIEIQAGEEKIVANPGCFIQIPSETAHSFQVRSATAKMLVLASSPAKASKYLKAIAPELQQVDLNSERITAISTKYDVQILEPIETAGNFI